MCEKECLLDMGYRSYEKAVKKKDKSYNMAGC
mgnify:CR=1 FL=1